MKGYNNQSTAMDADELNESLEADLDIPTFLRREKKNKAVLDIAEPAQPAEQSQDNETALIQFLERLNRRLDHAHACLDTVASLNDLKRYGLPSEIVTQLEPIAGRDCSESCMVAAFLNKLARHPNYGQLLSQRVKDLIQNYVQSVGIICVQLEACIHPIVYSGH